MAVYGGSCAVQGFSTWVTLKKKPQTPGCVWEQGSKSHEKESLPFAAPGELELVWKKMLWVTGDEWASGSPINHR